MVRHGIKRQIVCLLGILLFLFSCQTVPITGRQQLSLIPSEQILSMSFQSYTEYLSQNTVITDTEDARMVKRVGRRIQNAVERYFADHNMHDLQQLLFSINNAM